MICLAQKFVKMFYILFFCIFVSIILEISKQFDEFSKYMFVSCFRGSSRVFVRKEDAESSPCNPSSQDKIGGILYTLA
jgi:hypothetical protein